jgi:hypothetical protein
MQPAARMIEGKEFVGQVGNGPAVICVNVEWSKWIAGYPRKTATTCVVRLTNGIAATKCKGSEVVIQVEEPEEVGSFATHGKYALHILPSADSQGQVARLLALKRRRFGRNRTKDLESESA